MTVNNTDYKDLTIENDGGWICKPVLLVRQSLWESDNRRVRFLRTLPGQILIAVWLFCILRGLLGSMLIQQGLMKVLSGKGPISTDRVTLIATYSMIFVMAGYIIYMRFAERRSFPAMGFIREKAPLQYLAGLIIGFLAFLLIVLITVALTGGQIVFQGNIGPGMFMISLLGWMIQGMSEEVGYRGYMFLSISRKHKEYIGVICSSLFFGLTHAFNSGATFLSIINTILVGFALCFMFIVAENIWFVGAFHSAWNFAQGNVFGISVSGHEPSPSIFVVQLPESSSILSGGAYGIEANIFTTILVLVIIGGSIFIIKKFKKSR